jgi:hypothetical protein
MRLLPLLLALGVCTTVSAALRAPWLERAAYSPERRQPTQTHTAPQRRASAGMTEAECIADGGDYILPDYAGVIGSTEKLCSYYEGDNCNSGTKAKPPTDGATTEPVAGDNGTTDPVNKRKRSGRPSSDFMGEILDPRHVVKFLLSDTGTFKHDNGSMYYDPIYNRRRRNGIERNVAKGVISRLAAQSLSAFVKVRSASSSTPRWVWPSDPTGPSLSCRSSRHPTCAASRAVLPS